MISQPWPCMNINGKKSQKRLIENFWQPFLTQLQKIKIYGENPCNLCVSVNKMKIWSRVTNIKISSLKGKSRTSLFGWKYCPLTKSFLLLNLPRDFKTLFGSFSRSKRRKNSPYNYEKDLFSSLLLIKTTRSKAWWSLMRGNNFGFFWQLKWTSLCVWTLFSKRFCDTISSRVTIESH